MQNGGRLVPKMWSVMAGLLPCLQITTTTALAQIPISTFSHIWVLVRQYGIMFVIIVIIIIIIIIIQKSKSINTEACLIAH